MNRQFATIAIFYTILIYLGFSKIIYAEVYKVGDHDGWGPGIDYSSWVKGKSFLKGDDLVFVYGEGDSVDEVNGEKFKECDPTNSIFSANDGNTSIPLKTSGVHYFIGGSFQRCPDGMNVTVIVN